MLMILLDLLKVCQLLINMKYKTIWKILVGNTTNGNRDFVYVQSKELYDAFEIVKKQFAEPNLAMLAWERIVVLIK